MPYGYVFPEYRFGYSQSSVEYGPVLDIAAVPDAYGPDISAQYGPVPYAAVVPYGHIAYKCRIVSDKGICPHYRGLSVKSLYYHNI